MPLSEVVSIAERIRDSIETVIEGKREQVQLMLTVFLAGGHLLVEDVPGVGKTTLAKALGQSIEATVRRIQFTPDLLPSDVTGVSVYNQETHEFEFKPGGIFANIVVADEINRASPKTQSALLEAMAERQVSIDGVTHKLQSPFIVLATQNPIEMEGTYQLPEAQRDRFMARISMGYPTRDAEIEMLNVHSRGNALAEMKPVTNAQTVIEMMRAIETVHVEPSIRAYIVDLVAATRNYPKIRLGASPRASLHLLQASRSHAALSGRDYVSPDDVQYMLSPVLSHRLSATAQGAKARRSDILSDATADVPVP